MSYYTTTLGNVLTMASGGERPQTAKGIRQIITDAWEEVFGRDWPIFDEDYRQGLCRKICEHYWFYEICDTPVERWKFFVQRALNERMPYFNQLYQSELIKFDPLKNTDYDTKHTGRGTADGTEDSETAGTAHTDTGEISHSRTDTHDSTTGHESTHGSTSGQTHGDETTHGETHGDTTGNETTHGETSGSTDGSTGETRSLQHSGKDEWSEEGGGTSHTEGTTDGTKDGSMDSTRTDNLKHSNTTSSNTTTRNLDTPQGALDGILNNDYLTSAQLANGSGSENGSNTGTQQTKGTDKETTHGDAVQDGETTDSREHHGIDTYEDGEKRDGTHKETTAGTSDVSRETTGESDTTSDGTKETNGTSSGTSDGTRDTTGSATGDSTTDANKTGTMDGRTTGTGHKVSASETTDEYLNNVFGKVGTETYSEMLMKYRQTFLNIDLQVIETLRECFMQVWEPFDSVNIM